MRDRDLRIGQLAGIGGALVGLAVVGFRSGADVAGLGAASVVPVLVGAGVLLWLAWRFGGMSTRAVEGRRPLALMAAGAIGALEVLLIASLALFCTLLTLLALGAGGDWMSVESLTYSIGTATPSAAAVAAVIGVAWGAAVALSRRS